MKLFSEGKQRKEKKCPGLSYEYLAFRWPDTRKFMSKRVERDRPQRWNKNPENMVPQKVRE